MNPTVLLVIDALLAILTAKLRSDSDPLFLDLVNRVRAIVSENRDPSPEDESALEAFLASERAKLHR